MKRVGFGIKPRGTPVLTRKAWELNNTSGQWTFLMESFEEEKCRR